MSEIEEVTEGFRKLKIPKPAKPKPPKKLKLNHLKTHLKKRVVVKVNLEKVVVVKL